VTQFYFDASRESDSHALPDGETFYVPPADAPEHARNVHGENVYGGDDAADYVGWFWWACFPGCLPGSEPMGPFNTEAEALADAREGAES